MLVHEIYHHAPQTINENESIKDAVKFILKDEFNGLVVLNNNKKVVGVLALQDIAAATVPHQFRNNIQMANAMFKHGFFHEMCQEIQDKKVKEIMRKDFIKVNFTTNIMAVMADFLRNDLYIVPVIEKGELKGVVTRTEIKKALAVGMGIIKKGGRE